MAGPGSRGLKARRWRRTVALPRVEALDRHQGRESQVNQAVRSWIPLRQKRQLCSSGTTGGGKFQQPPHLQREGQLAVLNDRRPELAWTRDKLDMKERAAAAGVRTPETYWQGRTSPPWPVAPARSLGTQAEPPVVAGPLRRGRPDIDHLQSLTVGWIDETQSKVLGEWAYSQARPLLLVEEQFEPRTLYEYKFFVMNGTTVIVQVDVDRFGDHRRNVYTPEWEPFDTRSSGRWGTTSRRREAG